MNAFLNQNQRFITIIIINKVLLKNKLRKILNFSFRLLNYEIKRITIFEKQCIFKC